MSIDKVERLSYNETKYWYDHERDIIRLERGLRMNFDFSYLDIAFKNGSVITVNETDEIAEAVGVKGNKIVFVGSNEDIEKLIDE